MNDGRREPRAARLVGAGLFVLFVLLTGVVFILPGHPAALDTWPHLVRQSAVADALRGLHPPFWSFEFYCGYPLLQFYGPLFALLGGLLAALLGDGALVLKLLLFLLHVGSGFAMLAFLRRRARSPAAALLGAALYVSVPWRVLGLGNEGNYPQALVYLLLPLVMLALDRLLDRPTLRAAGLLGLLLGLIGLTHAVYAAFVLLFVVIALVARLPVLFRSRTGQSRDAPFWKVKLAGVLGFMVAAGSLVPLALEFRRFAYPQLGLGLRPLEPLALFWFRAETGGYGGGYLGIVLLALALAGAASGLARSPRRDTVTAVVGLGLSLLLAFVAPRFAFTRELLTLGLPPARFLVFYVFFASALASLFAARLLARVRRPTLAATLLAGLFALAGADCLPFLLRARYSTPGKLIPTRLKAYEAMRGQEVTRVLDLPNHEDRVDDYARLAVYPAVGQLFGGFASALGPPFHQFAPRSMTYVYPWANAVATDLGDPAERLVSLRSFKALALMGVSHVVTPPTLLGREGQDSVTVLAKPGIAWDDRLVRADLKPPLLFGRTGRGLLLASAKVVPYLPAKLVPCATFHFADDWQALVDAVEIDPGVHSMSFIPAAAGRELDSLPGEPALRIERTLVEHHEVRVRFQSRTDCFLRVALSWHPRLDVRLDGRRVEYHETKDHFIYLRCPAGPHELRVKSSLSPLRRATLWVSLAGLLACAALLFIRRRRPPSKPEEEPQRQGDERGSRNEERRNHR